MAQCKVCGEEVTVETGPHTRLLSCDRVYCVVCIGRMLDVLEMLAGQDFDFLKDAIEWAVGDVRCAGDG